ncbi:MAG: hypothetical protein IJH40_07165 [Ruminococcus sp.]|uniref:hypothetical protein n=1 Tax=Ruminococcus sp. TaxID=41978 RepID=UPI002873EB8D|nr:hypothetical protein [Ruminococcus sp.]MBQ3285405.1 hypothetical protein [Ruminococcus sp.]
MSHKCNTTIIFKPLQDIYRLRRKIWSTEDAIDTLIARNTAPKNQTLSDMPKGGSGGKKQVEEYLICKEALLNKLQHQREAIYIQWLAFLNGSSVELSRMDITLLRLRYFKGYRWKKCVRKLQLIYPAAMWNENKAFRTHKHLMKKLNEDYYFE